MGFGRKGRNKKEKEPSCQAQGNLARSSDSPDHTAMILLTNTDIEEDAEPDAENIEIEVAALDGRRTLALEVADFKGIDRTGLPEEIPRGIRSTIVLRVRKL